MTDRVEAPRAQERQNAAQAQAQTVTSGGDDERERKGTGLKSYRAQCLDQ